MIRSIRGTCWYCHAVAVDTCPKCGSTPESRKAEREFYASFRSIKANAGDKNPTTGTGEG